MNVKYEKIGAEQFARTLLGLKDSETLYFASDCNVIEPDYDEITANYVSCWYGAVRLNMFDSDIITICHYGGGYVISFDTTVTRGIYAEALMWLTYELKYLFDYLWGNCRYDKENNCSV
jgi:hypothetical protein